MAWTESWPIVASDGYNDTLFADELDVAALERANACDPSSFPATTGHFHTHGDDMQTMGTIFFDGVVWTWQHRIEQFYPQFVDTTIDFPGDNAPYDPDDWRWTLANLWGNAGVDPAGWHAEYPRTISIPTDTTYIDGDTPVDGEFALNGFEGRVYERVAGAWVLAGNVGMYKPTVKVTHRKGLSGDYLNKTMFNEIHDALDLMRWKLGVFASAESCSVAASNFLIATGGSSLTWPDVQDETEGNYLANSPGGFGSGPSDSPPAAAGTFFDLCIYTAGDDGSPTDDSFIAEMACGRVQLRVDPDPGLLFAFESDYYSNVKAVPIGNYISSFATPVFDANGADVVEDKWHRWDSTGPANAPQISIYVGRDRATYMPNWCTAPAYLAPTARGFRTAWILGFVPGSVVHGLSMVLRFDVSGGFDKLT